VIELDKICVNKWMGRCPDCKIDFDETHNPNNYDCKNYIEMHRWKVRYYKVEEGLREE